MIKNIILIISLVIVLQDNVSAQNRNINYGVFDIPVDELTWEPLDSLGVGWVREQFRLGEVDIDIALPFYSRIFSEGYGLILTLYHRDSTNIENMESFRQSTRGGYPPADSNKYKSLVFDFVGTLAQEVIYQEKDPNELLMIQFCNEVVPIDIVPDNKTRFWHGTSDEYLETLAFTYDAIKSAPAFDIPIVNAGISSLAMEQMIEFESDSINAEPELREFYYFNDRILREGKFDWADVHLRHAKENVAEKIQWVKERWNGKLAATEFAGPDPRTEVTFTEEIQAQELVERMQIASTEGVDIIFWSHLVENPAVDEIYFHEGLIEYETWRRKPAFYAYKDYLNTLTKVAEEETIPQHFVLNQNYPNPFNPSTIISYQLSADSFTSLTVYNILGKEIEELVSEHQSAGKYEIRFTSENLSSGFYFYTLKSGNSTQTKKMILLK